MRPGPEYRLLRGALKTEYFFRRKLPAVFFHEPDLPTGLPDMVAVYLSRDASTITERRRRLTPAHVRLLHGLHSLTSSTPEELGALLRIEQRELSRLTDDLMKSQLITVRENKLFPERLSRTFAVRHIVAIEAKVGNWSRALQQAAANRWFASQSFILIPPTRSLTAVSSRARELGVGVLTFDGGKVRQVVESKRFVIPASYGSWLFNEWALRHHRVSS